MSKTNTASHRILITEDNASLADIYEFKFSTEGFDVRVAHNGEMGLESAKAFLPHLILLDLRMPVMNGDEMLEKLRSEDWGGSMRVVVLTNISKDEAPRSLRFLGVDRYVVKAHHTPSQVVSIVRDILGVPA